MDSFIFEMTVHSRSTCLSKQKRRTARACGLLKTSPAVTVNTSTSVLLSKVKVEMLIAIVCGALHHGLDGSVIPQSCTYMYIPPPPPTDKPDSSYYSKLYMYDYT